MADDPKPGTATDDLEPDELDEIDTEAEAGDEDGAEPAAEPDAAEPDEIDPDLVEVDQVSAPAKTESKAARTIRQLRERAQKAERERDDYLRRQAAPRAPDPMEQARIQEERRQRLALMDPEQRTEFLLNEQREQFNARIGGMQFQTADAIDQAKFDRLCDRNPVAEKYRERVEETLQEWRRNNGSNPGRAEVLRWILGDEALKRGPAAATRQRNGAEARRARQTVPARGGRGSDVTAPGRGGTANALQKRIDEYDRDGMI